MSEVLKRPVATKEMILDAAMEVAVKIDADAATIAQYYHPGMDGYELAKELDKYAYWDTSRAEMEALDDMDFLVDQKVRAAVKEWATSNDIQPPLPVGTRIKEGVITGIDDYSPATYRVKENGCTNDSRSRLIRYEDAVSA